MQHFRDGQPGCVERRLERRLEALPSVREEFRATGVRAHVGDDHVMVLLHFTLNRNEAALVARGSPGAVLELRHGLQGAMEDELVRAVEAETARGVEVFTSANHLDPNVGVETFLLAPRAG